MANPNNLSMMLHSTARSMGIRSRTKYLSSVVSVIVLFEMDELGLPEKIDTLR